MRVLADDKADDKSDPEAEIEVTPEMIEAGLRVLRESGAVENPIEGVDGMLIEEIYRTMVMVSGRRVLSRAL